MMGVMTILSSVRGVCAAVPGVASCKVGLEANLTPADYPMVHIVPSVVRAGPVSGTREIEALVYFGQPVHEFSGGLEALYTSLMTFEALLLAAIGTAPGVSAYYTETILDEDRVDAYKLMAMRVRLVG